MVHLQVPRMFYVRHFISRSYSFPRHDFYFSMSEHTFFSLLCGLRLLSTMEYIRAAVCNS